MDAIQNTHCTPHPLAYRFLFEHKRETLRVFRDVVGYVNLDHISIAYINLDNDVIFLSHTPSLEYNLIHSGLWAYDLSYCAQFYHNHQSMYWEQLYDQGKYNKLLYLKQQRYHFTTGFSIPIQKGPISLIYSFATQSQSVDAMHLFLEKQPTLIELGDYCFNQLEKLISPFSYTNPRIGKPRCKHSLKLVISNSCN